MDIESKIVGRLNSVDYDSDLFESSPFAIPYFDNQKIKINFVEAKVEEYLNGADNALKTFLNLNGLNRLQDSEIVKQYYDETLKFGYTKPLDIKTPEDIWKFVWANEIFIHWDENGDFYIEVSGGCEWEEEHGLQLIFDAGQKLTRASGHE